MRYIKRKVKRVVKTTVKRVIKAKLMHLGWVGALVGLKMWIG